MKVFEKCVVAHQSDPKNELWPINLILKCALAQQAVLRPYGHLIYDHSLTKELEFYVTKITDRNAARPGSTRMHVDARGGT